MQKQHAIGLLALLALTACGGGGGGDTPTVDKIEGQLDNARGLEKRKQIDVRLADGAPIFSVDLSSNRISFESNALPRGFFSDIPANIQVINTDNSQVSENITLRGYRGFHSNAFVSSALQQVFPEETTTARQEGMKIQAAVATDDLPVSGQFTYRGYAFDNNPANDAALTYHINFGRRRGFGEIAASRGQERMILEEESIRYYPNLIANTSGYGVKDGDVENARDTDIGKYKMLIAGPNAEEVIGEASYGAQKTLLLSGVR